MTAYLTLSKVPIPYDRLAKVGYRDKWIARKGDTIEAVVKAGPTPNEPNYTYAIVKTKNMSCTKTKMTLKYVFNFCLHFFGRMDNNGTISKRFGTITRNMVVSWKTTRKSLRWFEDKVSESGLLITVA